MPSNHMIDHAEGFGLIIGLEEEVKIAGRPVRPVSIYFRNKIVIAPKGHRNAAAGKWAFLVIKDDVVCIIQVMIMNMVQTRFYCRTDFKIYAKFVVIDEETVHNEFCGLATIVPEHREFVSEARGYVFGTVRPNEDWELMFQWREPPDDFPMCYTLYPNYAYEDECSDLVEDRDSAISEMSNVSPNQLAADCVSPVDLNPIPEEPAEPIQRTYAPKYYKGLGLPYREDHDPMPPLPKPTTFTIDDSDGEYELAETNLTYEEYCRRKVRQRKAREVERPCSLQYFMSRSPEKLQPLVLHEEEDDEFDSKDTPAVEKENAHPNDETPSSDMYSQSINRRHRSSAESSARRASTDEPYSISYSGERHSNVRRRFTKPLEETNLYDETSRPSVQAIMNPYLRHDSSSSPAEWSSSTTSNGSTTKTTSSLQYLRSRSPLKPLEDIEASSSRQTQRPQGLVKPLPIERERPTKTTSSIQYLRSRSPQKPLYIEEEVPNVTVMSSSIQYLRSRSPLKPLEDIEARSFRRSRRRRSQVKPLCVENDPPKTTETTSSLQYLRSQSPLKPRHVDEKRHDSTKSTSSIQYLRSQSPLKPLYIEEVSPKEPEIKPPQPSPETERPIPPPRKFAPSKLRAAGLLKPTRVSSTGPSSPFFRSKRPSDEPKLKTVPRRTFLIMPGPNTKPAPLYPPSEPSPKSVYPVSPPPSEPSYLEHDQKFTGTRPHVVGGGPW